MMTNTTNKVIITSSAIVPPTKIQSSLHDGETATGGHCETVGVAEPVVLVDDIDGDNDDDDDDDDDDDELVEAGISQFSAENKMQAN